jgi:hypothetical protein
MSAAGVFAGGGIVAPTGTKVLLAGSAAWTSGEKVGPERCDPTDLAEAALAAAISSTTAGNGGAADGGRVETSGGGGACAKRSGGGPTARRYGSDGFAPGTDPGEREEVARGLGATSDANAGTKRKERQRMNLAAAFHQGKELRDFIQIAVLD